MTEPPEGVSAIEWSYQQNRKIDINLEPRQPVFMQLADSLRANILSGQIAPGERLPGLEQLARQASVSRMTVQQALRVLKDEGLVRSHQGKGIYVTTPGSGDVSLRSALARDLEAPKGPALFFCGLGAPALRKLFEGLARSSATPALTLRIILVRAESPTRQEIEGLAVAGTVTDLRWLDAARNMGSFAGLPAFIRLTSGEVFLPLDGSDHLEEPGSVVHFTVNPSETDSLAKWFAVRWEESEQVKPQMRRTRRK